MLQRFSRTLLLILILPACETDRSAELEAEINKRVNQARKQYTEACNNRTMARAEKLADSLLLVEARQNVNDSLRNRLPGKPLPPAAVVPLDSSEVAPLFPEKTSKPSQQF